MPQDIQTRQTTLGQATAASFAVGSGSSAAPGGIKMNIGKGSFGCTGTSPTITPAGTLSLNSSNFDGRIVGNGTNASYTISFTNAFTSVPVVICTTSSSGAAPQTCNVISTSGLVLQ